VPVAGLRLIGRLSGKAAEMDRLTRSLQVDGGAARHDLAWSPPVSPRDEFKEMARHFHENPR
jgi:UDP-glucose 4-epimerase